MTLLLAFSAVCALAPQQTVQEGYLKSSTLGEGAVFGYSVSVSGDTAVVGAHREFEAENSAGAAYVFTRTGNTWSQQARLTACFPAWFDTFGFSTDIEGDTLVVCASGEDGCVTIDCIPDAGCGQAGAAYVYSRSGTTWTREAHLKASNTDGFDEFGRSCSLAGDTLVVGAPYEDSTATTVDGDQLSNLGYNRGAAYVYVRTGTTWSQQAYLKGSDTGNEHNFGTSIAADGDTIVVGTPRDSTPGTNSGAVYVFVRNGSVWTEQARLKAANFGMQDQFGRTVSLSGDTLVVGAPSEDANGTGTGGDPFDNSAQDAGAAYVFVRNGTNWTQEAYLKASNTDAHDFFGRSVAIDGDRLVVGASQENSPGEGVDGAQTPNSAIESGACYVFERSGTNWSQTHYLKASNAAAGDQFGVAVDLDGDTLFAGAWREDSDATGVNGDQTNDMLVSSGAAYVFNLNAGYPGTSFCMGVACPCGNDDPSAGCANNTGVGALMSARGTASAGLDTLELETQSVPPNEFGLFFMGANQINFGFGNGWRCVGGLTYRVTPPMNSGPGGTLAMGQGLIESLDPGTVVSGSTWLFQTWFRDPNGACAESFNTSNAVSVTFTP